MSGWKLIGGLTIGTFQEATDVNKIRHFNQVSVRMGLRCPLLGTRKREQLSIPRAEARAWEHRHRLELAARIGRNALRSHYLNYWGCERRMALSRAFLEDRETVERVLKDRTSKGFLLDADRQELLSAFDLAVRNIANDEAMRARALGVINLLTGGQLKGFASVCPSLPQPCVDETRLKAKILNGHPELALRRGALDEQLGARSLEGRSEVDANLDFAGSASMDYPSGQPGYGFTVSLNVQLPAGIRTAGEAARRAAQAGLNKAKLGLDQKTAELLVDAAESVERYHAAYANLRFALQRVKAALESVREHQLRAGYLPGDTLEKLQQNRFRYYQASLDLIDAEVLFLQSQAALLHLAPGGCEGEPSDAAPAALTQSVIANDPVNPDWLSWPKPLPLAARIRSGSVRAPTDAPAPGVGPVHPTAAYHWETTSWLDGSSTWEEVRQRLAEQGVGRVLLGLDGAQIRWVQTPEGGRALRQLLESARSSGIRVELLLGEPTWILEGPREELLAIVQQLREFSFDGLHLDLEPDQLDTKRYSREYLLGELAHTLQAVRRVSAWPMGISIHPRYFEPGRFKLCLRCALETMQLSEVVLMVYVSDPLKAARRVRPILKATPNVRFSVAVSVEPELDPSESYAGRGRAALGQALERLKRELSSPNFLAVVVQSWRYLEGMKP